MKRHISTVLAAAALGASLLVAMPAAASAACNLSSPIQGSAFYNNSACGGSLFNMSGNSNRSYVGDDFNDKLSSILIGKRASGSGTVSTACLWKNQGFSGTLENWVNGSATQAKYINLTSDPLNDEASAASTQWGAGSVSPTCSW